MLNRLIEQVSQESTARGLGVLVVLSILLSLLPPLQAAQAGVAGYSEYYIPGGSDQLWDIFEDMDDNPSLDDGLRAVIAVTASSDNITLYYDHWEDGYGFNPNDPSTADETVSLAKRGDVHIFESEEIPTDPRGTEQKYDGRDRIYVAGGPVAVTRASWPEYPGTVFALTWELYPTKFLQKHYTVPVGEDLAYDDFDKVYVIVQATEDNTKVEIEDTNQSKNNTKTINSGEVMSLTHIHAGTTVSATEPVQVQFIVGSSHGGRASEARGYTMVPDDFLDDEYYAPVGGFDQDDPTEADADVYLYNPSSTSITITYEDQDNSGNFSLDIGETKSYLEVIGKEDIPVGSGVYFSSDANFWGIGSVDTDDGDTGSDTDGKNWDWGYDLVPAYALTEDYFLGWAPGYDGAPNSEVNGSPVFVTPAQDNTVVYVDYRPTDGIPDDTYILDRLASQKIFDPDKVNTGMHIWATGPIAVAWGEDPETAEIESPYLDVGYTVVPLSEEWVDLALSVEKTVDPVVVPARSVQTAEFTIIASSHGYEVNGLTVTDTLPITWTYKSGSTQITLPDGSSKTDDPTIVGQELSWGSLYDMDSNQAVTITFEATSSAETEDGDITWNEAQATVTRTVGSSEQTLTAWDNAYNRFTDEVDWGTIGNRVWLDEDGDGVQDVGEAGIPNVVLELYDEDNTLVMTTTTDTDGGYLFSAIGTYTVEVDSESLPSGLKDNPTYDEDGTDTAHTVSNVTVDRGVEHLTADFGYNWASSGDTDNPGSGTTGAIGDRVWIDADGDGVQDPGEPGLDSVPVKLYTDSDGNGVYDNEIKSTSTDAAGNYIFDDLAPGSYVVEVNGGSDPSGYSQTGDPDDDQDNKTSNPLILAPGDVFVNADFGYKPSTSTSYSIGDKVWFDPNGDDTVDAGEYGIPGVTVALIEDTDGSGTWDADEPIIATDITDGNGDYEFTGLPSGGDYLVWVNDTNNVLGELAPRYDHDGLDTPASGLVTSDISALNLGSSSVYTEDFGYAPNEHQTGKGIIGDFIFLDADGEDDYDAGEPGLEGVTVTLTISSTGDVITTTSSENGYYYFGNLDADTYTVTVSSPTGLTNSVDPDGGSDNQSVVVLASGEITLTHDFGYKASNPNTIEGTIWEDTDADGTLDGDEGDRFEGVTVALLRDGDIVFTDTTDSDGNFSFTGLPDGEYLVDVTDDGNVLNGYWHSDGPSDGTDSNSQDDPYSVSVTGGETNSTADFGYYIEPGALGDFVWIDANADGIQDDDEPGISGVNVTLVITYPTSPDTVITATDSTDASGKYRFDVLMDEDYNDGGVSNNPSYSIRVEKPAPPSPQDKTSEDKDSDNPDGEPAIVVQGQFTDTYDFGFQAIDTGDLDDPPYLTDPGNDGARHAISQTGGVTICLGASVDYDNGAPNEDATGDDDAGDDDEDGVEFASVLAPGGTASVVVTASTTGYLNAWTDFNDDGDFDDAGERIFTDTHLTSAGGHNLNFAVPATTVITPLYTRFRFTYDNPSGVLTYTGYWDNGEVEDHRWAFIGDLVWEDLNGDGIQDNGEPGLGGVIVELYDSSGNLMTMTTTAADGSYGFVVNPGDAYSVTFKKPVGYTFSPQGMGSDDGDSDADVDTGETTSFTAQPGYNDTLDAGLYRPAVIGNRVWLDKDSDGYQEAGEPGLPNVVVSLTLSSGAVDTATTDSSGGYLFDVSEPGVYTVAVRTSSLPAGMIQTTRVLTGADFGNQTQPYVVNVTSGQENLTADFGYNWDRDSDVAVMGDRVWSDADGDGAQDPGEIGIPDVTVELYQDGSLIDTTTTNVNGSYAFTDVVPGYYVVKVVTNTLPSSTDYTQTGDPDHFGVATGENDSQITTPVYLGAGEVFLNADFGYQPDTAYAIGDTIFLDANGNSSFDTGEPGIPGVSVALIADTNGNGAWDSGEPIIASDIADGDGEYLFEGLLDGDYIVWVNDTDNVLGELVQTSDPDGTLDGLSAVNIFGSDELGQDFGYAPLGHDDGDGLIGDTVFLDRNDNSSFDPGEGLEDVTLHLYLDANDDDTLDAGDLMTATTTTDENGHYAFGDLPSGKYIVVVITSTMMPNLSNTVDPDNRAANQSVVDLSTDDVDLEQDFGYAPSGVAGSIGNFVWDDVNADGDVDTDELGLPGVTVDLYLDVNGNGKVDVGEPLMGMTTTNASGHYTFTNLVTDDGDGDADYLVKVTDDGGVLVGRWHTLGERDVDNNSQITPYAVEINGDGPDHMAADMGYSLEDPMAEGPGQQPVGGYVMGPLAVSSMIGLALSVALMLAGVSILGARKRTR